jgi:hypothetical protein
MQRALLIQRNVTPAFSASAFHLYFYLLQQPQKLLLPR